MAVIEEQYSNRVSLKLNSGETETGAIKTVSVSLGSLKKSNWNDTTDNPKAVAIVNALIPCLAYNLYRIEHVQSSYLEEE